MTQMTLSMEQKQNWRHRDWLLPRGMVVGEGWIGSLGLADANWPTYSTGNYTQYPVKNHNGKEYEKNIYIYK